MSDIGVWILYRHWCIIYTIGKSEDKLYYIAESIDSTPYSVKSRGMETDSYNNAYGILSWGGEISLKCRRQCLVNQAVNPYARGILIWRWNVSSDLKIQFLINRVWWLFYVQFRFWRFSFWLIEKLIEKSRVGTRGLCISKMSICQLMLKWKCRSPIGVAI